MEVLKGVEKSNSSCKEHSPKNARENIQQNRTEPKKKKKRMTKKKPHLCQLRREWGDIFSLKRKKKSLSVKNTIHKKVPSKLGEKKIYF